MMLADQIKDALAQVAVPMMGHARESFLAYLRFSHGLMQASEVLLDIAARQSRNAMLRNFYQQSLQDEQGHALWIAEDIASMGGALESMDHAVAWIAGSQYYYLHHIGVEPLLGYIAAMEMRPPKLDQVRRLEERYGARAVRTIRHHAEQDIRHGERLAEVLNEMGEHREKILYNAVTTATAFSHYCGERISP